MSSWKLGINSMATVLLIIKFVSKKYIKNPSVQFLLGNFIVTDVVHTDDSFSHFFKHAQENCSPYRNPHHSRHYTTEQPETSVQ